MDGIIAVKKLRQCEQKYASAKEFMRSTVVKPLSSNRREDFRSSLAVERLNSCPTENVYSFELKSVPVMEHQRSIICSTIFFPFSIYLPPLLSLDTVICNYQDENKEGKGDVQGEVIAKVCLEVKLLALKSIIRYLR